MHGPLTSSKGPATLSVDISTFDGAAGMPPQAVLDNPSPMPKWKEAYYKEVILPDERKFLFSEALDHVSAFPNLKLFRVLLFPDPRISLENSHQFLFQITRVPPQTVKGERKVVIDAGKSLIEVKDEVWKVWREYEAREKEEEERKEVNWS